MPDIRKALAGIQLPKRGNIAALRDVPLIAEIEALLEDPSVEWRSMFTEKRDAASLALFGITKADTEPREPHPDDIPDNSPTARFWIGDEAFANYDAKLRAWYDLKHCLAEYEAEAEDRGLIKYWRARGYDVGDEYGAPLRCIPHFVRQLYVAVGGLLPGAKVTLDGGGRRAAQSTDDWGAALAADAARWRRSS